MNNNPSLVLLGLLAALVLITKIMAENRTRRRALELRTPDDLLHGIANLARTDATAHSLKWGLLAVGLGLGAVVVQFLPPAYRGFLASGVLLLCGGGALLLHYLLTRRAR